jgi:hypothetical protein
MTSQEAAAEHLRVIRGLMERATVYRAISGPTALFGGGLALVAAGSVAWLAARGLAGPWEFLGVWLAVLALVTGFNFALVFRGAARRGEPFVSPGMRLALLAIAPPMAAGGVVGVSQLASGGGAAYCAAVWAACYGLALLATSNFAPRSIRLLGSAFLAAGLASLALWHALEPLRSAPPALAGSLVMGATFGLLHLAYAACVGLRATPPTTAGDGAAA